MADIKKIIEGFTKEEKEELKKCLLLDEKGITNINWRPTMDEEYCCINDEGESVTFDWEEDDVDRWRLDSGNVFKTKEQANNYKKYLLMKKEIKSIILARIGQEEYFKYCQLKAQFET